MEKLYENPAKREDILNEILLQIGGEDIATNELEMNQVYEHIITKEHPKFHYVYFNDETILLGEISRDYDRIKSILNQLYPECKSKYSEDTLNLIIAFIERTYIFRDLSFLSFSASPSSS